MTSLEEPYPHTAAPMATSKDMLLLRLGSRIRTEEASVVGPSLRRLVSARERNTRGIPLTHAPHSHRCHAEHVPRWVQHCRSVIQERSGRSIMEEREKLFIAMGFFTLTIMRRWRKWASREVGLRRLLEKRSFRDAFYHWKRSSRLIAFLAFLKLLALRGAVHRWRREMGRRAAFELAVGLHSRSLTTKVWRAWVAHRSRTFPNCDRLRDSIERWQAWRHRWKTCVDAFRRFFARRALTSAMDRWRRVTSVRSSCCRRRREVLGHLLGSFLLRKCFAALVNEVYLAAKLRRLLERHHKLNLLGGFEAWRRWLLLSREAKKTPREEVRASSPGGEVCLTGIRRRGKPRKGHCRCVYAISRRERCTCAPRTHLLRRVEELHRLVAKGLDRHDGGHRLLSHVVQRASAPTSIGTSCLSKGNNSLSPLTVSADSACIDPPPARTVGEARTNATNFGRRAEEASLDKLQQPGVRERRAGVPTVAALKEDEGASVGICSSPTLADVPRCSDRDIRRGSPCRRAFAPSRYRGMTHW